MVKKDYSLQDNVLKALSTLLQQSFIIKAM